jgi:flagellar basal body-associated protein FliL
MRLGEVKDDPEREAEDPEQEAVKGTSGSLIAVIAVLACVLVVVLVGGFLLYRRSKNQGAQYAAVTAEKPEL